MIEWIFISKKDKTREFFLFYCAKCGDSVSYTPYRMRIYIILILKWCCEKIKNIKNRVWIESIKKHFGKLSVKNKTSKIFGCKNKFLIQTNLLYNKIRTKITTIGPETRIKDMWINILGFIISDKIVVLCNYK